MIFWVTMLNMMAISILVCLSFWDMRKEGLQFYWLRHWRYQKICSFREKLRLFKFKQFSSLFSRSTSFGCLSIRLTFNEFRTEIINSGRFLPCNVYRYLFFFFLFRMSQLCNPLHPRSLRLHSPALGLNSQLLCYHRFYALCYLAVRLWNQ